MMLYLSLLNNFRYEMRFNLKTGLATQKKLSESAVDFPRVNESYTGRYASPVVAWRFLDLKVHKYT